MGDLFNYNEDYEMLELSSGESVTISTAAVDEKNFCKNSSEYIYEDFKDHYNDEAIMENHGPVFCNSLNGELVGFPETLEDVKKIENYIEKFTKIKGVAAINVAFNAYVFSSTPGKPDFGYPPGGYYAEFFELGTDRKIPYSQDVTQYFQKEGIMYQQRQKLCVLTGIGFWGFLVMFERCSGIKYGTHSICVFKKKIVVKLSGLCSKSPVDKIFSLMEPIQEEGEAETWDALYRHGTFTGTFL